jgi:hypothetical protein
MQAFPERVATLGPLVHQSVTDGKSQCETEHGVFEPKLQR